MLIVHTENKIILFTVLHTPWHETKCTSTWKTKNGPKAKMSKKSQGQPYVSLRPFLRHFRFSGLGYCYYQPFRLMFCWWLQPAVTVFKQSRHVPKLHFRTRQYLRLTLCWSCFKLTSRCNRYGSVQAVCCPAWTSGSNSWREKGITRANARTFAAGRYLSRASHTTEVPWMKINSLH